MSCQSQEVDPQVTQNFCLTWPQIGGSHGLLLFGFDYLLEQLTEPRETYTDQGFYKGYDEQPHRSMNEVCKGPGAGASVPVEVGYVTLPGHVCQPKSSWNLMFSALMETSSHRHD